MRLRMLGIVAAMVAVCGACGPARAGSNPVVVLAFAPTIAPLSHVPMPVYLPTWLPSLHAPVRALSSFSSAPDASDPTSVTAQYRATLAATSRAGCQGCELISIVGANEPLGHPAGARRMPLVGTVFVFFWTNSDGAWMSWRIGKDFYRLHCSILSGTGQSTTPCSVSTYKRVVMSVVRVN